MHILIDSRSTRNFLDIAAARTWSCDIKNTVPLHISVANESRLISSASLAVRRTFTWSMQEEQFHTDVMLVALGSCERTLDVQWLATLGPILWYFDKLKMGFNHQRQASGVKQKSRSYNSVD